MECLDDADVSIRLRALDLVAGMVNANNLTPIVERLMRQLRTSPLASAADDPTNDRGASAGVQPAADSDDENAAQSMRNHEKRLNQPPPLPDEYRSSIIQRILDMCSRNTYSNINDFDWYLDILVQLVKHIPAPSGSSMAALDDSTVLRPNDVAAGIGFELRNVAVRVKSSRPEATRAAELLLSVDQREQLFPRSHNGAQSVLEPAAWVVGEYAEFLYNINTTMNSLIHSSASQMPPRTLGAYLHTVIQLLSLIIGDQQLSWTEERKSMVMLLIAKITHFLEPLTNHPNLEVQERAVEYLELTRLANEAASAHKSGSDYGEFCEPPLLLTQAIPALFNGMELNPVARDAQKKVPIPEGLDLDKVINENLSQLLNISGFDTAHGLDDEFDVYYNHRPLAKSKVVEPAFKRLQEAEEEFSYQQSNGDLVSPDIIAKRRAERKERYKDDPFYIPSEDNSGTSTPLHNIIKSTNGEPLDVDSIPIMELDLGQDDTVGRPSANSRVNSAKRKPRRQFEILADETLGDSNQSPTVTPPPGASPAPRNKTTKSLLQVDSSGLGSLSLEGANGRDVHDIARREAEEAEMVRAMKEVERLRLEMQRASETIEVKNGPPEGVVVKRKKKKTPAVIADIGGGSMEETEQSTVKKKKKKKTLKYEEEQGQEAVEVVSEEVLAPKKKKKRRQVTFDEEPTPMA